MIEGIKKYILQLLLIGVVAGGLYAYLQSNADALKEAKEQTKELKRDNKRLEDEAKDLREQSPVDKKTSLNHSKAQGVLEVKHAVAIEKVQHEVDRVLQEAPVENRDSRQVVDAVSSAVVDGMWDSYNSSVRGEVVNPPK